MTDSVSSKDQLRTVAELKDLSIGLKTMHMLLQANIVDNAIKLLERLAPEPPGASNELVSELRKCGMEGDRYYNRLCAWAAERIQDLQQFHDWAEPQITDLNRTAHEPGPNDERIEAWYSIVSKMLKHNPELFAREECGIDCALLELDRLYSLTPPPSLLREIATVAYDTSKAAEDRIREIQDLWEGAGSTKGAGQ